MNELEGLPGRLRKWREEELEATMEEVREAVNEHLPPGLQIRSKSSLYNWETARWSDSSKQPKKGPRAEFLVALKRAYPDLNLRWLLFGHGPPRVSDEDAQAFLEAVRTLPEPKWDALIPSDWLRRHLPRQAKQALLAFFDEVFWSDPGAYSAQPDEWGDLEDPIPWKEARAFGARGIEKLRQEVCDLLEAPLRGGERWASADELAPAELTTFVLAQLAAIRPLVRSLRTPTPSEG